MAFSSKRNSPVEAGTGERGDDDLGPDQIHRLSCPTDVEMRKPMPLDGRAEEFRHDGPDQGQGGGDLEAR